MPKQLTHQIAKPGYLESQPLGVTVLAAAGVVLIAWVATAVLRRRRGRRLLPGLPRVVTNTVPALSAVVLFVIGAAILANAYIGYAPSFASLFRVPGSTSAPSGQPPRDVVDATQSRVVRINIPAAQDGIASGPAYVYLPPGYDEPRNARRHYATIYLIHGSPGRAQDWFTAGSLRSTMDLLLGRHYIGPMIAVSPTASTGFLHDDECLNTPGRLHLESYLADTVVDSVDRSFRTIPTRSGRAIGGMSSGGFCALNIGLHHLHRFSVILASEPYGDPGMGPLHRLLHNNWAWWRANSPFFYLPRWRFAVPVATFLDSGGRDRTTTHNAVRLAHELSQRGQSSDYRLAHGQTHSWREARAALPYALIFAWQHFGRLRNGGSDRADAAQFANVLNYAATLPPPQAPRSSPPSTPSSTPSSTPGGTPTSSPTKTPGGTPTSSPTSQPAPRSTPQPPVPLSIPATRSTSAGVSAASQRPSRRSNNRNGP